MKNYSPLIYLDLNSFLNEVHRVCAHRLAGGAFDHRTSFEVEARTMGAARYYRALDWSIRETHAVVGTDVVDGEEALANMKNR